MKWIGITGGIASGKSFFCEILRQEGNIVLSADDISRIVMSQNGTAYNEIVEKFGKEVLTSTGEINRKVLGQIVFSNKDKLSKLESITHHHIRNWVENKKIELEQQNVEHVFYEVPLLFEKKLDSQFNEIIAIVCDPKVQLTRLMNRDALTEVEAEKRLLLQVSNNERFKRSNKVFLNNDSKDKFRKEVLEFLKSKKP